MLPADPFPIRRFAALTYSSAYSLASGAIGTYGTEQVFRLNSLYDPDFTGVGHQPYGHDQLALLYSKYKVHRVGVYVEIEASSSATLGYLPVLGMTFTGPEQTASLTGMLWGEVDEKQCATTLSASVMNPRSFSKTFNMQELIGCTKQQFGSDVSQYSASLGANPASIAWLRMALISNVADTVSIVRVRLVFETEFWDRIPLAQS